MEKPDQNTLKNDVRWRDYSPAFSDPWKLNNSGASTLTHVIAHKMRRHDGWRGVDLSIPCLRSDLRRLRAGFGIPVCDDSMGVKDTYSRPLKD